MATQAETKSTTASKFVIRFALCAVLIGVGITFWKARTFLTASEQTTKATTDQNGTQTADQNAVGATDTSQQPDNKNVKANTDPIDPAKFTGVWENQYYGKRVMRIRTDGTATTFCTLNTTGSWTLGTSELVVQTEWSYEDGWVTFTNVDGTPKSSFKRVLGLWGPTQKNRVEVAEDDRIVFVSEDGETTYEWRRTENIPPALGDS